jgi:uncharacterized membrane protein YbaN (DUF454 family)
MIKQLLLYALATALLALGLLGLLVPVLPGVLFLLLAGLCVSLASPRAHQHLSRHAAYRKLRNRWDAGAGLSAFDRIRLAFWSTIQAGVDAIGRRPGGR